MFSTLRNSRPTQIALLCTASAALYHYHYNISRSKSSKSSPSSSSKSKSSSPTSSSSSSNSLSLSSKKVAVDSIFIKRLRSLLPIILPGLKSKESFILGLHTCFLISRTLLSIYVAKLDGQIVKSIVDRKLELFIWLMSKWMLVALPATYVNSMIAYLESKLAIAFRSRLVNYCYKLYMSNDTYYRVGNLDSRLSNPDQSLTEDISVFSSDVAHLYSHLSKPCLDVVLMTIQLILIAKERHGEQGVSSAKLPSLLAAIVVFGTAFILKFATPPFGKLIAEQAKRYGELRAAHSRVITHSEEIAFYGGHQVEELVLQNTYENLIKHTNYIYKTRIFFTMLEQFLMRYVWGACGMVMIALPAFSEQGKADKGNGSGNVHLGANEGKADGEEISSRTQDFITSRGLLVSAADAIERMMSSWRLITELAGRTARITEMIEIFQQVQRGEYEKKQTNGNGSGDGSEGKAMASPNGKGKTARQGSPSTPNPSITSPSQSSSLSSDLTDEEWDLPPSSVGEVVDSTDGIVELFQVPIVTPNGDLLVKKPGLSFRIEPGMHLLITGPNGCGKSSLFRMLGGLWPVRGGLLRKPRKGEMFYIPQRPYLTKGTLREQFIYPDSTEDMTKKGISDADLERITACVNLKSVVEREGGWDAENDWRDVLSGGEKQRVACARCFYHKPKYAILDECTSAVSIDVEGQMYEGMKQQGITLLTVTHRPTLFRFHTHLLQFDGNGNYHFSELNASTRLNFHEEKAKIESSLQAMPKLTGRLKELCELLGESSIYAK